MFSSSGPGGVRPVAAAMVPGGTSSVKPRNGSELNAAAEGPCVRRVKNRRDRFREAMARLDAAADPARAIERGFYVERPGRSVESDLAARLELRPASSHLVIGGVGSGKTTLLMVAQARVNELPETRAIYVDVSVLHDLNRMAPGVLVVLAGLLLSELSGEKDDDEALAISSNFREWAHAPRRKATDVRDGYRIEGWVGGILSPAGSPFDDASEAGPEFHAMATATTELSRLT